MPLTLNKISDIKNRQEIYAFIVRYPGVHLRKICKELKSTDSTIRYHLKCLKKSGLIEEKNENGYSRFFCTELKKSKDEIKLIHALRQKTRMQIILFLLISTCSSKKEISKNLDKDFKTITFHLKKLEDVGLIEKTKTSDKLLITNFKESNFMESNKNGREEFYVLKDPYLTYNIINKHRNKLFDNGTSDDLLKFFESCFVEKKPKVLKSTKVEDTTDRLFKKLFEVFPFPWTA